MVSLSSAYHPQSNGQTEQLNLELGTCLCSLVSQTPLPGASTSSGLNMHTIRSPLCLLVSPISSMSMATTHPSFLLWRVTPSAKSGRWQVAVVGGRFLPSFLRSPDRLHCVMLCSHLKQRELFVRVDYMQSMHGRKWLQQVINVAAG